MSSAPPLYATEPARFRGNAFRWLEAPPILFKARNPICETCGSEAHWTAPPERRGDLFIYKVSCQCVAADESCTWSDEIIVDWPLRIGGTPEWWASTFGVTAP